MSRPHVRYSLLDEYGEPHIARTKVRHPNRKNRRRHKRQDGYWFSVTFMTLFVGLALSASAWHAHNADHLVQSYSQPSYSSCIGLLSDSRAQYLASSPASRLAENKCETWNAAQAVVFEMSHSN